jgi:hypothetical protein
VRGVWGRIEFLWATTHPFRLKWWIRAAGWLLCAGVAASIARHADVGAVAVGVVAFEAAILVLGALRRRGVR